MDQSRQPSPKRTNGDHRISFSTYYSQVPLVYGVALYASSSDILGGASASPEQDESQNPFLAVPQANGNME
jgi:hypothetical protein